MERPNDSPARARKQALCIGILGGLLVLAAALDPGRTLMPRALGRTFLVAGLACLAWALWGGVFRGTSARGNGAQRALDDDFFARHKRTLLTGLFAVHGLATLFFFPPADIVNDRPVVTLDHAFHYYQAWRAHEVFLDSARLHAYDPFFMAGYPSALFDLDVKSLEAFGAVFPASQLPRAVKFYILVCYLSMVVTVYAGCRLLRLTERESILAVSLLLVFWHWGRPYASHFRYAGMFDFICVSHFSILVTGLLRKFLQTKSVIWWLVLGPLAYFIHPTAVVILSVPYACVILCGRRSITPRTLLLFLIWCIVVVAVNSLWIVPLLEYASLKTATKSFFQTSGIGDLAGVLFRPGCLPAIVLLGTALVGVWRLAAKGRRPEAATLGLGVIFLLFISAYGVFLPGIEHLEPGRFLLTALFFSAPLAGVGASLILDAWHIGLGRHAAGRAAAVAAMVVLILCPMVLSYLSARTGYRHRLRTMLSPAVRELVEAIKERTDPSARLMIEDGPAAMYDEVHLPGFLPAITGVEQIGGPYPYTFIEQHFVTFEKDWTMGRTLSKLSAREFWGYVDLYNVRWIVVASGDGKSFVRRIASDGESEPRNWRRDGSALLVSEWRSDRYEMWRVTRAPTFTGSEGDRVTATFNRIQVDLAEPRESFLLRYHWDRGLEIEAPAVITPVLELDDPVPLILVEPNGATSFVLRY